MPEITLTSDVHPNSIIYGLYLRRATAISADFLTSDEWTTSGDTKLSSVVSHTDVSYRRQGNETAILVRFNAVALVSIDGGTSVNVSAAGRRQQVESLIAEIKEKLPVCDTDMSSNWVWMKFWYYTKNGPTYTTRKIQVPTWDQISPNYPEHTRTSLGMLMRLRAGDNNGKLVIWHGPPGTGKTYAVRALASELRKWCSFEYIVDPDSLFGSDAEYLAKVVLSDDGDTDKWRMLVLEDTGELISADAKTRTGQGLSRLLNFSDGLIGQGTRVMSLITTNEELGKLHTAVLRPGRCFANIKFPAFSAKEASDWLKAHDRYTDVVLDSKVLADLINTQIRTSTSEKVGFR